MKLEANEKLIGRFDWHLLTRKDTDFHHKGLQRLIVTDRRLVFKTAFFFEEFEIRNINISCIRILGFRWSLLGNTAAIDYAESGIAHTHSFSARGSLKAAEKMFKEAGIDVRRG